MKLKLLLILLLFIAACQVDTGYDEKTMCFEQNCFDVQVPLTDELKQQGLMHVEHLENDEGMLFVFEEESIYHFWMKNTIIPLDIIWLNSNLEVVHIEQAQPCLEEPCKVYTPNNDALYVLEINQGLSDELGITTGSSFYFK